MNIYAIPPLVVSFLTLTVGLLVLIKGKKPAFTLVTVSVFVWLFGYSLMYSTKSYEWALILARLLYVGVVFIPACSYHFTMAFLNMKNKKAFVFLNYLMSFIFVGLIWKTNFIAGLYRYYWGYQTKAGFSHNIFLIFFFIVMMKVVFLLYRAYQKTKEEGTPLENTRIKYVMLSFMISVFAATDFLPNYGIKLYPLGFICIALHAVTTSYAILRYRLMDIDLAVRGILSFLGYVLASLIVFVPLVALTRYNFTLTVIVGMLIISLSPVLFKFVPRYTRAVVDKILFHGKFGYLEQLNYMWENNHGEQYTSHQIGERMVSETYDIMELENAGLFLYSNYHKAICPVVAIDVPGCVPEPVGLPAFTYKNKLIEYLSTTKTPLIREEIEPNEQNAEVRKDIDKIDAELIFPIFANDKLIGMLSLGAKASGEMFHAEDIKVLKKQVETTQNHLSHTIFMEERASFSRQLAHDMKNLFAKAIDPTVDSYLEAKDEKEKKRIFDDLLKQLSYLGHCLRDNFDLISILEKIVKQNTAFVVEDISRIVAPAVSFYKASCSEKGVLVELDIPNSLPKVMVNREDILKVFNNLFDNAIKFTKQGKISIKAQVQEDKLLVSFSDTGWGIPKDNLETIFDPKVKMPEENEGGEGTGLGLVIIKDIIEGHKSKIWVESEKDKGTTFYFTLPLAKESKGGKNV